MKFAQVLYLSIIASLMVSCEYFVRSERPQKAVARVGENYLYKEDLNAIMPAKYTPEDSINIVKSYINNWAIKELLVRNAQRNITEEEKADFERLINEYRADLYTNSYKESLINNNIDTTVTANDMALFYERSKNIFTLNESLIKLRYIQVPEKMKGLKKIEEQFKTFSTEDAKILDSLSIKFNSIYLNDSVWVKTESVLKKLPFLDNILATNQRKTFITNKDESNKSIYYVQIEDILKPTENAPIEYVESTLKQIILNQRKLEFVKKLESDVINTGIKNKQFEIYE